MSQAKATGASRHLSPIMEASHESSGYSGRGADVTLRTQQSTADITIHDEHLEDASRLQGFSSQAPAACPKLSFGASISAGSLSLTVASMHGTRAVAMTTGGDMVWVEHMTSGGPEEFVTLHRLHAQTPAVRTLLVAPIALLHYSVRHLALSWLHTRTFLSFPLCSCQKYPFADMQDGCLLVTSGPSTSLAHVLTLHEDKFMVKTFPCISSTNHTFFAFFIPCLPSVSDPRTKLSLLLLPSSCCARSTRFMLVS